MKRIAYLIGRATVMAIGVVSAVVWTGAERIIAAEENTIAIKSAARKVDLNTASVGELEQLPGMGPEAAERIVRHRPYRKLDELIVKRVLSRKQLARIKTRISVHSVQLKGVGL